MLLPAVNRWSHSVFGLSVCLRVRDHILKYVNTISYEPIVGISPNSELRCRYDEDELIWFWGQKVTGQGHGPRSRAKVTMKVTGQGHWPRSQTKVTMRPNVLKKHWEFWRSCVQTSGSRSRGQPFWQRHTTRQVWRLGDE